MTEIIRGAYPTSTELGLIDGKSSEPLRIASFEV